MSADQPEPPPDADHDPPEYWWYHLDDAAFDLIFSQAQRRASEIQEFASQRDRRLALLVAWTFALIGGCHLIGALEPGATAKGAVSWTAISLTAAVIGCAFWYIIPRRTSIGLDPSWLASYARSLHALGADVRIDRLLAGQALADAQRLYDNLHQLVERRSLPYHLVHWLALLQGVAVLVAVVLHFAGVAVDSEPLHHPR